MQVEVSIQSLIHLSLPGKTPCYSMSSVVKRVTLSVTATGPTSSQPARMGMGIGVHLEEKEPRSGWAGHHLSFMAQ